MNRKLNIENNKIIIGDLFSKRYLNNEDAQKDFESKIKAIIKPSIRKGSNNQWFGVLEDREGNVIFTSKSYNSEILALESSNFAYKFLNNYKRG